MGLLLAKHGAGNGGEVEDDIGTGRAQASLTRSSIGEVELYGSGAVVQARTCGWSGAVAAKEVVAVLQQRVGNELAAIAAGTRYEHAHA
jgi:hypothetical protein